MPIHITENFACHKFTKNLNEEKLMFQRPAAPIWEEHEVKAPIRSRNTICTEVSNGLKRVDTGCYPHHDISIISTLHHARP